MRVHRQRQGGRAAVGRHHAESAGELGVRGAAAAELDGHAGREDTTRAELGIVVVDERVLSVVAGCPRGEARPELSYDRDPVTLW